MIKQLFCKHNYKPYEKVMGGYHCVCVKCGKEKVEHYHWFAETIAFFKTEEKKLITMGKLKESDNSFRWGTINMTEYVYNESQKHFQKYGFDLENFK